MQDGNCNDSDEERELQLNPNDEKNEEEDINQTVNSNSVILEAIKSIKKELSINHISGKNSSLNTKMSKYPIISLDKLSCFLLKFVKKANLSLINRRILFAAITPIHHMYLHVINGSQYKNISSQSIQSSILSPPFEPNSLKKCFDYFLKVFNLVQYDLQQINEAFFIQKFEKIIEEIPLNEEDDSDSIKSDIEENIQSIVHNFEKLHEHHQQNKLSYKQIRRCKVEVKRLKIIILPLFKEDEFNQLRNDFLSYYKNFYGEIKNFELFYKVNWIIDQFKNNWDQPLFWFLPCQMAKIDSDLIFNSAMEYLQTFWMTLDLNIIDVDQSVKSEPFENENSEKNNIENENNNSEKIDTDNGSVDVDSIIDPEGIRLKMFDMLDILSYQNKLEPQNCNKITRSFMQTAYQFITYFNINFTLSTTNFDIEDIKTIFSIVNALPYTMKDVAIDFNIFLSERVKLLKQYMYIYNSESNKKFYKKGSRSNFTSLFSNPSITSTSSTASFAQKILCNASFNEIFAYVHSFITFSAKAKETPTLYPIIKNELHRLTCFYSELLLKVQMMNDSRTLVNEALQKAKEYEMANLKSLQSIKQNSVVFHRHENEEEKKECVDLFYALKELTVSTRRVLQTKFIKDEKRDFMERFYTFLKICCPYFQNLKQQQLKTEFRLDMPAMKEFLSAAFPLFDTHDIFRFEPQNLEDPEIISTPNETESPIKEADDANLNSDDITKNIDLKSIWSNENKELLFDKSFPTIREQARNLRIGVNDDWRSIFQFKAIYKTFCRLFIVAKPQLPINENPTEFERDVHKFFSIATNFVMDENFNIHETIIPLSTIINSGRSLSIKWMFCSNLKNLKNENEEKKEDENKNESESELHPEVSQEDKQHWELSSLLFGIAFISVPHPIQTISVFLMMLSNRDRVMEAEGRQLNAFSDLYSSFLENFNNETADLFVKNSNVQNCLSLFDGDLDFFYHSDTVAKIHQNDENDSMLLSNIQKQNIGDIINEINQMKDKYLMLSDIMTMMNSKYFGKPDSYSRLFVEIAFYANILKSFKDTLEILKRFNLLSAPTTDSDLATNYMSLFNSTWPFSPGFLDLDMYKSDLPNFLSSLHTSILRLSNLKPNFKIIHRTFDFYMNLALSTYSYCFSSITANGKLKQNLFFSKGKFSWNRNNYGFEVDQKSKEKIDDEDEEDEFIDLFKEIDKDKDLDKEKEKDLDKNQMHCIDEIKVHFHALGVLYSDCNEHPSILICCEVLARTTKLIKLLINAGLSDFSCLATILSGLSEVCFAIINALNIKKEVDQIVNATIYFASLFGIRISKSQKIPSSPVISRRDANSAQQQQQQTQPSTSSSQPKKKKVHQTVPSKGHSKPRNLNRSGKFSGGSRGGSGSGRIKNSRKKGEDSSTTTTLADFNSLLTSVECAAPIFERMAEMIPKDSPEIQHFYRARTLFNSIHHSLNQVKVPTSSEQFAELLQQSNMKMEMLRQHSKSHLKRLHAKIDNVDQKFKKMQSLIESDYSCINQKIEDETIKGEQLDEDIANIQLELSRLNVKGDSIDYSSKKATFKKKQKKKKLNGSTMNSNSNSNSVDVLNFNFNLNSPSSSKNIKNKPIAKAQLIMAQAQELQRQNQLIQIQLQKNELEHSILCSIENGKNNEEKSEAKDFVNHEESINKVVQNIMKNASEVLVPHQQRNGQFDIDEDEKPSNVLSKGSIYSIMTDIIKWDEQQQNITSANHNEICDKVEMLAYSLINGTKSKENEMLKLQNQLKNVKSTQKDKLIRLKNILRDIDLDEE